MFAGTNQLNGYAPQSVLGALPPIPPQLSRSIFDLISPPGTPWKAAPPSFNNLGQQPLPFSAGPTAGYAPQGFFGDLLGAVGAPVGGAIGGLFGNARTGQQIGGTLGSLAQQYLPWSAGPAMSYVPQGYAPQGFFGDLLGAVGAPVGGAIGGLFGNSSAGQQIGGTLGSLAQQYLPWSAGPAMSYASQGYAPQGFFGDLLGAVGAPIGTIFGGPVGGLIGGGLGALAQEYLPFSAGPAMSYAPQGYAPQGFFGDLLGAVGAPVGGAIGGLFGNARTGQQIGGTLGSLAQQYLPWSAGPSVGYAPQGFFGDLLGAVGAPVGGAIGGLFGNARTGQQIGGTLGSLAQQYLPWSAGPSVGYAPQGFFGDLLGAVGAPVGGAIGGLFGNTRAGQQIGGTLGSLAQQYLPWSAGPAMAGGGSMQPSLSLSSSEPSRPTTAAPKSILIPESAVPAQVRTALALDNAVMQGAANGAVTRVVQYLGQNPDKIPEAQEELSALADRALDFIEHGDYQSGLTQAYLANLALDTALQRELEQKRRGTS